MLRVVQIRETKKDLERWRERLIDRPAESRERERETDPCSFPPSLSVVTLGDALLSERREEEEEEEVPVLLSSASRCNDKKIGRAHV